MDTSEHLRLLTLLHENIKNLPLIFSTYGIVSDSQILSLTGNLAKQVHEIVTDTNTLSEVHKDAIKSLKLETEFVKKLYMTDNDKLNSKINHYKNEYYDTLNKLKSISKDFDSTKNEDQDYIKDLKSQIKTHIDKITELSSNLATKNDQLKLSETSTRYLKDIIKIIYPNYSDNDVEKIKTKLVEYIQRTREHEIIHNNLKQTITNLQNQVSEQDSRANDKLQFVIDRCNKRLLEANTIFNAYKNNRNCDDNSSVTQEVDLINIISANMDSEGSWHVPPQNVEFAISPDANTSNPNTSRVDKPRKRKEQTSLSNDSESNKYKSNKSKKNSKRRKSKTMNEPNVEDDMNENIEDAEIDDSNEIEHERRSRSRSNDRSANVQETNVNDDDIMLPPTPLPKYVHVYESDDRNQPEEPRRQYEYNEENSRQLEYNDEESRPHNEEDSRQLEDNEVYSRTKENSKRRHKKKPYEKDTE